MKCASCDSRAITNLALGNGERVLACQRGLAAFVRVLRRQQKRPAAETTGRETETFHLRERANHHGKTN